MPLVERFVVGVDIRNFSARIPRHQVELQRALDRMLGEAAAAAGLDRTRWECRQEGDGETAMLPPGVDLLAIVRRFVSELDTRLTDHNEDHAREMEIRLRVAMHTDVVTPGHLGPAGPALIVLKRLLDSAPVRAALTNAPAANLAQIISEPVFQRAVLPGLEGVRPRQFREVLVEAPEKGFRQTAYLYVPGQPVTVPETKPPPPPTTLSGFTTEIFTRVPITQPRTEPAVSVDETPRERAEPPVISAAIQELVEKIRESLERSDIEQADTLTTRVLLESANRTHKGALRISDGPTIPDSVLADVDAAWAKFSSDAWGFRAQRQRLTGLVLSDPRAFRLLSVLVGWRAGEEDPVPRYQEFIRRADHTTPFYPTLRNPDRERYSGWHDEWRATVISVHTRLQGWEC